MSYRRFFSATISLPSWMVWLLCEIKECDLFIPQVTEDNEGNWGENNMRHWKWEGNLCPRAILLVIILQQASEMTSCSLNPTETETLKSLKTSRGWRINKAGLAVPYRTTTSAEYQHHKPRPPERPGDEKVVPTSPVSQTASWLINPWQMHAPGIWQIPAKQGFWGETVPAQYYFEQNLRQLALG